MGGDGEEIKCSLIFNFKRVVDNPLCTLQHTIGLAYCHIRIFLHSYSVSYLQKEQNYNWGDLNLLRQNLHSYKEILSLNQNVGVVLGYFSVPFPSYIIVVTASYPTIQILYFTLSFRLLMNRLSFPLYGSII